MTSTISQQLVRFRCGRHSVVWAIVLGSPICTIVDDGLNHLDSWCNVEPSVIQELIAELHELLQSLERETNGKG
jgi:hypothetical protein